LLAGDLRALARAATLVENQTEEGRDLLSEIFPKTGRALTVGITGPPGAGKSTLVNRMVARLRAEHKRVGVVAVDPSSPFSQGAILGDRIRMQEHHGDPGVFIRSMATRGQLGGLAAATLELALLIDAAGFDVVLIETVGVGQDEIEISRLADVTVLVLVPQMGDDVQAIKAGIVEIADVFAINKSDLPGAERLEQEIRAMQSLSATSSEVQNPPVRQVCATEGKGIDELIAEIFRVAEHKVPLAARAKTWEHRLRRMVRDRLYAAVREAEVLKISARVAQRELDPFRAVSLLSARIEGILNPPQVTKMPVRIDHLGIAVRSIDQALSFYRDQLGMKVADRETVDIEKVHVAMLPAAADSCGPRIELLEASEPGSVIGRFIEKRGAGLHHVALKVDDLLATVTRLETSGARLLNEPRQGAGGHLYVFVHPESTGGILLELIQA